MKLEFETHNPFTGERIRKYVHNSAGELKEFLTHLENSQRAWKAVDVEKRVEVLRQALTYFEENRQLIASEISQQMGKPLKQSLNEVNGFFERSEFLLNEAPKALRDDVFPLEERLKRNIRHEPHGVVLVLSAWNYPLMIALNGVLSALLAGNTVLLKHAEATLSIGEHFEKAFGSIEGHEGLLKNVVLSHETVSEILADGVVDHVVFTGSVDGGHAIYENAAKHFIDCHLEMGGKDAAYVAEDANMEVAAAGLVDGAMYNAGQSCCGIERVYVHKAVVEEFVNQCQGLLESYTLGDPFNDDTDMGPLVRASAADFMLAQIEDAVAKGAKVLCGGKVRDVNGSIFFEPTLLTEVNHTMSVMREENFGPIMPVMKVDSDAEAVEKVNDSDLGLTAAIFTASEKRAREFAEAAETGTVYMNRCDYLDPDLPWTGYKNSGKGSGLSKYCFYGMTKLKSLNFKLA